MSPADIVQKLWNYCNVLRDDGMSYGDYVEQLTYLLFLKMADEGEAVTQETTQEKIMASLRAEPTLTRKLLAQRLSISENGVKYHLKKFKAAGRIRHVGPTKAGRWEVIEDRSDASGDDGTGVGPS